MGTNNDDRSGEAESFDFAPRDTHSIGGPSDMRFSKTTPDPMAVNKNRPESTTPNLSNSTSLAGGNFPSPPDPYEENLTGKFIAQNYEIIEKVGEGGMSAVYRARHTHLNREVAVKMLHPHLVSNRTSRERFSQEARAVSQIEHPNVVRLLDFGITEENRPYIVMDFLRGKALSQIIKQSGPMDIASALSIFVQICDALAYTHEKGIVHRDLKPSNIILLEARRRSADPEKAAPDLVAKIVDFGIAKLSQHEEAGVAALTQTGDVFGSPLYMSPEQARGEKLDNRADIYSMGCLMYECLTGVTPVTGTNMLEILYRHMNEMPKPMNTVGAANHAPIPRNLEAIVFKALAKEPKDRYQDMRSMMVDLEKFAGAGPGLMGSLASIWSLYRSRRQRLNVREKVATIATSIAILALILCATGFGYFFFKGTEDFSQDRELTWLTSPHKNQMETFYNPTTSLVLRSLRGAETRIAELRELNEKQPTVETTEADSDMVQTLLHNATELKQRGNLDESLKVLNASIDLGCLVHGTESVIVRQALVLKTIILYESKKYPECVELIHKLQREVPEHNLYGRTYFKAMLYSILGECEFHVKTYEKARGDLLEALNNWNEADSEKEKYDGPTAEIRSLAYGFFADCFYQDGMWEEAIKYYQKAEQAWKSATPQISDYNRALAKFKQSMCYAQQKDFGKSEPLLKEARDLLRRYPKEFYFCQTEAEMTQLAAKLDQQQGNWVGAAEKFVMVGLSKNRTEQPPEHSN